MGPRAEYVHPVNARKMLVEGPFSAVLLMASGASGGKLSLVEHPLAPRALGSPMHTHSHEDEYSYILGGQVGAQVGEEVILLPFTHQDSRSPYRASGPIFVRRGRPEAARIVNELPPYLTLRPLSVRAYDAADQMVDAEVVDGAEAESLIERYLAREDVAYLHIHYARRGCFACRVDRF